MILRYVRLFALVPLLLTTQVHGADVAIKSGIIKGTITVAGKPTADVVVSLEGISAEIAKAQISAAKPKKAVMDQRDMKFIPHVLAVLVGTTVEFPNHDTSWHNVYSKGDAKDFDLGLYPPGKTRSTTFDKPGVARILCNAHPNMEAFIVVKQHPFFSNPDKGGSYRLDGVPLGKYRIQVWHPQLGTTDAGVELVRAGEVLEINFDLKKK
ncbi:MAG TPA: plastocyanin/azurin family copper-binding protein [Candidatus Binatia bacterium]|nr:plastocyanin/azurin family copper-binding protein [Candidatus Binatia bacterium]